MRLLILPVSLVVLFFASIGCKGDNNVKEPPQDVAVTVADQPRPDRPIPDEPFGRICTELGKECKEKDLDGQTLYCISVSGAPRGKGFCSRQCTDVGNECYGVPNGEFASCILTESSGPDAGASSKYCGFLCKSKSNVWTCPATMRCGPQNGDTALCIPQDIKPPDRGIGEQKGDRPRDGQGIPSNSGRICNGPAECAPGDDCLLLTITGAPTPTHKMCVMSCKEGTSCPVPSGLYSSMCYLEWNTKRYCVWFCEYQGKSYQCPDTEAFQCITPNPTEPGVKICIPK